MRSKDIKNIEFDCTWFDDEDVEDYCKEEYLRIINSPKARGSRSNETILEDCMKGARAEMFLIENFNYRQNPKPYHDLISDDDIETEVKVRKSFSKYDIDNIISSCSRYNDAEEYIFFTYSDGHYKFFKKVSL